MALKNTISFIKKILSGTSSKEEEQHVNESMYRSFLSQNWSKEQFGDKEDVHNNILMGLSKAIDQEKKLPRRTSIYKKVASIAAAVLLVLFTALFVSDYSRNQTSKNSLTSQKTILQPGSDSAILELNNGTKISLESLKVGKTYVGSGFSIKKTATGNLEYHYTENNSEGASENWNTLRTPLGGRYQIVLADGTKVWLNAGSTLTFPQRFSKDERMVMAQGEVFFEVSHNKTKPFVVRTNRMDVRVLGTSFNLNVYEDSEKPSVSLIEGSVQMKAGAAMSILAPGQKGLIEKNKIRVDVFDAESEIAWKDNYFIFKNQNIKEIMSSLARWYNADIEYQGEGWDDLFFTVRISRREHIQEILSLIELTGTVKFKISGRRVIVST